MLGAIICFFGYYYVIVKVDKFKFALSKIVDGVQTQGFVCRCETHLLAYMFYRAVHS